MTYIQVGAIDAGAISDAGASPYQTTGNPVIALIAQLNRFVGKTVPMPPNSSCGARNYLPNGPLPLTPVLDNHAATVAWAIIDDRLHCIADVSLIDNKSGAAQRQAAGLMDPIPWAMGDLNSITVQIAQFADSLGLDPATVGITKTDPKMAAPFPMTLVLLGVGALAALYFVTRRKS
jgi:hypothetical protein